jgi:hypothetical protein
MYMPDTKIQALRWEELEIRKSHQEKPHGMFVIILKKGACPLA